MPGARTHPFMKKGKADKSDWFRIENAHKDDESATDELTKVYIYGEIGDSWWGDSTSANDFVKLLSQIKSKVIELHVNSPGGSMFDGVAIYNALKAHAAEVVVYVDALAASAASFIAQAGNKIIMTKAATMMIHDASTGAYGDATYLRATADLLDKLSDTVAGIYADRAGEDAAFWRRLMITEVWYNAQEAVDAGLADEIGEDTKDDDLEDAENRWDLSIYNHAGRNAAPDPMELRRRIANTLKETPVTGPSTTTQPKTEEGAETTPPTGSPAVPDANPEADTTEGTAGNTDEERSSDATDGAPEAPEGGGNATEDANKNFVPQNTASGFTFMVNGQVVTDPVAVQNRLNMLESFRSDTMKAAREQFVDQLAADKKVTQPQVKGLKEYAHSLDDAGYAAWTNTWTGAPALSMLQTQPGGGSGGSESQTQAGTDAANELDTAREIVQQHKIGGMKEDAIKQTASYQKLIAADPNFKL